jgi:hypothetical protein
MKQIRMLATIVVASLFLPRIAAAAEAPAEGAEKDKLICRRTPEIGSLVRKKTQCFTKAEWDKIAEVHQRGARRLQEELRSKSGGQ